MSDRHDSYEDGYSTAPTPKRAIASEHKGWYGVDFDGTLAVYEGWKGPGELGEPIEPIVALVKELLDRGEDVRVFTARAWSDGSPVCDKNRWIAILAISSWCHRHLGKILPITCVKDLAMIALYDDRAIQVQPNTGRLVQDMGVPCPKCREEAIGCLTFVPKGETPIKRFLACARCGTRFERVAV